MTCVDGTLFNLDVHIVQTCLWECYIMVSGVMWLVVVVVVLVVVVLVLVVMVVVSVLLLFFSASRISSLVPPLD